MKKDSAFYQSKYEYYKKLNMWVTAIIAISSCTYFLSDLYIFGEWTAVTLIPRFIIIIPVMIFVAMANSIKEYKIMIPATFAVIHLVMWCTIWACTQLPDLSYASDGFIIIVCSFLVMGFAAPLQYTVIAHALLFVDVIIANSFLHYPDFLMFFLLGLPLAIGTDVFLWRVEKIYIDQYSTKHKLEESAFHDQLTGMYNRNIMSKITKPDTSFAEFYSGGLNIILMDIDFFKKVNDTYGHDKGDIVLKSVANIVMSIISDSDVLIRWGGEEFIIFTSGSKKNAVLMAEKIRQTVEASDNGVCPVTISLGVSKYLGGPCNLSIKHADEALYTSKTSGRNRVTEYND